MAGMSHLDAMRRAQEAQDQAESGFGNEDWKHRIGPVYKHEKLTVRFGFHPSRVSPFVARYHKVQKAQGRGAEKVICLQEADLPCEACQFAANPREKRVKRRSNFAAFWLFSTRVVWFEQTHDNPDGRRNTEHLDMEGRSFCWDKPNARFVHHPNGVHPGRTNGWRWEYEGWKFWEGNLHALANNTSRIMVLQQESAGLCLCGQIAGDGPFRGPAQVISQGWLCSECEQPLSGFDPGISARAMCPRCRTEMVPDERIACSASCGNPRRGSIYDRYVVITKPSDGKETAYEFKGQPFAPPAPEHSLDSFNGDFPFPDLSEILKADPAEMRRVLTENRIIAGQAGGHGGAPQGAAGWGGAPQFGGGQAPPPAFGAQAPASAPAQGHAPPPSWGTPPPGVGPAPGAPAPAPSGAPPPPAGGFWQR